MKRLLPFLKDILFLAATALVLNIISWLIIITKIKPNSEKLPLHYNVFYGIDFADKGYYIYIVPGIGLLVLVVNFIFSYYTSKREPLGSKILVSVALVVQALLLAAILFLKSVIIV